MGKVPKIWPEVELGEVIEKITNGTGLPQTDQQSDGMFPVTRIETISFEEIDLSRVKYVNASPSDVEKYGLKSGDILFSHINSDKHLGKTAINRHGQTIIHGINLLLIRTNQSCDSFYLNYYFKWYRLSGRFLEIAQRAVNQSSINQKKLKQIKVPLPPLPEQKRIVAKLDTLFAHLYQLRSRLDKIPVLLKQFRQAVLTQAVTGKLTDEWREKHEGIVATEELKNLNIPRMKSAEQLPNGWGLVALGDYVENHDGARIPVSSKQREMRKGKFPYYGATGIIDEIDDFTHDGEFLLIGEDGANLISRARPLSFLVEGKIWVNNHAHVVSCKGKFSNHFLNCFINQFDMSPLVTGSAQPKLTQRKMNTIPIRVPSSVEQKEIVKKVSTIFHFADRLAENWETLKKEIDRLPQMILSKAFSGELLKDGKQFKAYGAKAEELLMAAEPKTKIS